MALPRRRTTGVGLGTPAIPFDQSQQRGMEDEMSAMMPPIQNNSTGAGAPPADVLAGLGQGNGTDLAGLGMGTDALPTEELEQMAPEDLEAEQMLEQLQDPSTPPEIRSAIEAELEMAARRMMAQGGAI